MKRGAGGHQRILRVLTLMLFFYAEAAVAADFYVDSQSGSDANNGGTAATAFRTIQYAVDTAMPGDTINLLPGIYRQDLVSVRDGSKDLPIKITGPKSAVVKGAGNGRIVQIRHDYLTLDGFTIDGMYGGSGSRNGYRDILVYVLGQNIRSGVTGLKVTKMVLRNAGGECVRLRYFAQNNELSYTRIENCGVYDFKFNAGGKNGEGIYIGTAPEQLNDGKNPSNDPDQSSHNWIHDNFINTQGNECVDIKEGATGNIIENNVCTGQKDPNSGGMGSRGSGNIFRYNEIYASTGAGIRLGGDESDQGIQNSIYGNLIYLNHNGGIKYQRDDQAVNCGNIMYGNNTGNSVGDYGLNYFPDESCAADNGAPIDDSTQDAAPVAQPSDNPAPFTADRSVQDVNQPVSTAPDGDADVLAVSADSYVRDGKYDANNYDSENKLLIKTSGSGYNREGYMRFDIDALRDRPYQQIVLSFEAALSRSGRVEVELFTAGNQAWSEQKLAWTNKPQISQLLTKIEIQGDTLKSYAVDVTAAVKQHLAKGRKFITFAFHGANKTKATVEISSKESKNNAAMLRVIP